MLGVIWIFFFCISSLATYHYQSGINSLVWGTLQTVMESNLVVFNSEDVSTWAGYFNLFVFQVL